MHEHKLDRTDIDLAQLAAELTAELGLPLAVSARLPGQVDEDGAELPGLIMLVDEGGEPVHVDPQIVAAALDQHTPAPPTPAPDLNALVERLAAVEGELRAMRERAAATSVTNADAVKVRDAIAGPAR